MSSSLNLTKCLRSAVRAARESGSLLAAHVGAPSKVETKKSPADLVTEIDRGSEVIIKNILKRAHPDFGFLGEEHGAQAGRDGCRWVVDPLDGTMNFVHGIPFFGVSIGLECDGDIVAGVVYDPMRKECFTAARGQGAHLNGKPIAVSPAKLVARSIFSSGFSSKFRKQREPYLGWFVRFETTSHAVRRMGSTALSLAYVASGRMDAFYEIDLHPWDIAAGILLVEEAGGKVTGIGGKRWQLEAGDLVATNGRIHKQVLKVLKDAD